MNLEKLNRKRKELITDLSEEEIANYVRQLTNKYYSSYLNNDVEAFNNAVEYLKEVISIYKFEYPNLNHFVNYCLVESINRILSGTIASDVKLVPITEVTSEILSSDKWSLLLTAYNNGRENYIKRREQEEQLNKKIAELEQENRQLKEMVDNGKY